MPPQFHGPERTMPHKAYTPPQCRGQELTTPLDLRYRAFRMKATMTLCERGEIVIMVGDILMLRKWH